MIDPIVERRGHVLVERVPVGGEPHVGVLRLHYLVDGERRVVDAHVGRSATAKLLGMPLDLLPVFLGVPSRVAGKQLAGQDAFDFLGVHVSGFFAVAGEWGCAGVRGS
jgi:hypothetical protein